MWSRRERRECRAGEREGNVEQEREKGMWSRRERREGRAGEREGS